MEYTANEFNEARRFYQDQVELSYQTARHSAAILTKHCKQFASMPQGKYGIEKQENGKYIVVFNG